MVDFFQFLDDHRITFERFDHPPVNTVDDVNRLIPHLPGAKTKNLFLRDKKGHRHFLVVVRDEKRVDLKALPGLLESSRLRFGSPDRLKKHLGVDPGAVSLLAIFNDLDNAVEVVVDGDLWASEAFQFHPLVNTSTLVISKENLHKLLDKTGHEAQVLDVPGLS
jgi:Ala-tRNA(Pro) deacylase